MSETSEIEMVEIKLELASSPEMVEIDMSDAPKLEENTTDAMPHPDEIARPVLQKDLKENTSMQPLLRPEDIYNGKPRKVQLSLGKILDDVNDDANAPTNSNEEESKFVSQIKSEFDVLRNRAKVPNYNVIFDRKCAILEEVCNQDVSQDLLDRSVMQSDLIIRQRDCTQEKSNKSLAKEEDVSLINVPSNTKESVTKMFNKIESIWESTQSNNRAISQNHFEGFKGFKCTDDKQATILKEIDGNLVKNDIKADNKKIDPFGIDQVMLNVFGDLKAHTVVPLGDARLSEGDAIKKINEYNDYLEWKANRFHSNRNAAKNTLYGKNNETYFECKQCEYTTPSRRNWSRHKQTQKHKNVLIY